MFDVGMVEFEVLRSALDALVDVDPVGLTDWQAHRQLVELQRQQSRLAAGQGVGVDAGWDRPTSPSMTTTPWRSPCGHASKRSCEYRQPGNALVPTTMVSLVSN